VQITARCQMHCTRSAQHHAQTEMPDAGPAPREAMLFRMNSLGVLCSRVKQPVRFKPFYTVVTLGRCACHNNDRTSSIFATGSISNCRIWVTEPIPASPAHENA